VVKRGKTRHTNVTGRRDTRRHGDHAAAVSADWSRRAVDVKGYGLPPHLVMAATRYDPNAYVIVEVDLRSARHQLLNIDGVDWNTHFAAPYAPRSG
jgi:hypothetical protein